MGSRYDYVEVDRLRLIVVGLRQDTVRHHLVTVSIKVVLILAPEVAAIHLEHDLGDTLLLDELVRDEVLNKSHLEIFTRHRPLLLLLWWRGLLLLLGSLSSLLLLHLLHLLLL